MAALVLFFLFRVLLAKVDVPSVTAGYAANWQTPKQTYDTEFLRVIVTPFDVSQPGNYMYCSSTFKNFAQTTENAKFYIAYEQHPQMTDAYAFFGQNVSGNTGNSTKDLFQLKSGTYYIGHYADCATCVKTLDVAFTCFIKTITNVLWPIQLYRNVKTPYYAVTTGSTYYFYVNNTSPDVIYLYLDMDLRYDYFTDNMLVTLQGDVPMGYPGEFSISFPIGAPQTGDYITDPPFDLANGVWIFAAVAYRIKSKTTASFRYWPGFNGYPTNSAFSSFSSLPLYVYALVVMNIFCCFHS